MKKINFLPVRTEPEIELLARLADTIWHECFQHLLAKEQIDYMVETMQSKPALTRYIKNEGYEYFLIQDQGKTIGYIGIQEKEGRLFLSKLYLLEKQRGKGYAEASFEFLEGLCKRRSLGSIWLTVNKDNQRAIRAYVKRGFVTVRTQVVDIGQGFVMDDYVMELELQR